MTALARVQDVQMSLDETMTLGETLARSGFFADSKGAAQAVTKVLAGRELGIPPIAAMTGIHVISGKISLSANILASLVKRSGRYNYKVLKIDATECSIEFFENGESVGISSLTMKEAREAQMHQEWNREKGQMVDKAPWKKFPRNMLFARAMSNGVRWYCPDVTNGPIYTPEELGAETDEEGNVVDVTPVRPLAIESKPEQPNVWQLDGKGSGIERKVVKGISWITFTLTNVKVAASGELAAVLEEMQEGDVVTVWGTYKKSGNGQEFLQATMVQLIDAVQDAEAIEVAQV